MRLSDALTEYQYAILARSPQTQRWYIQKLQAFLAWCAGQGVQELEALSTGHIRKYLAILASTKSERTKNPLSTYTVHGYAQVIKGWLSWCEAEGLTERSAADRVDMPDVEEKVIQTFTPTQVKALFAASNHAPTPQLSARDRAILAVLFDTGIRASELCGLTLDCVHLTPQEAYLKVLGKGRKEREVGLGQEARRDLARYLTRYRHAPPGDQHIFLSHYGEPLTRDALIRLFYRLRDTAHIKGVRCSPHTARHTYAVRYLEAGGDIYKLSRLLGHTSVKTTEIYLKAYQAKEARKGGLSVLDLLGR